jgi:hypothetical protein
LRIGGWQETGISSGASTQFDFALEGFIESLKTPTLAGVFFLCPDMYNEWGKCKEHMYMPASDEAACTYAPLYQPSLLQIVKGTFSIITRRSGNYS